MKLSLELEQRVHAVAGTYRFRSPVLPSKLTLPFGDRKEDAG